jgi:hypothetical protein
MTKGRIVVFSTALIYLACCLIAQTSAQIAAPSVITSGDLSIDWQFSDQPDSTALLAPPNFVNARIRNTFTLYDVPVQLTGFWTTAQSPLRQNMNYVRLSFEARSIQAIGDQLIQRRITAIENSIQQLESIDKLAASTEDEGRKLFSSHSSIESHLKQANLSEQEGKLLKSDIKSMKRHEAKMARQHHKLMKLRSKKGAPGSKRYERFARNRDSLINMERTRQKQLNTIQQQLNSQPNTKSISLQTASDATNAYNSEKAQQLLGLQEELARLKVLSRSSPQERMRYISDSAKFFRRAIRLAQQVERFQIGTSFSTYSTLSLNAVPILGLDMAITPGKFYISACGGQSQRQVQPLGALQQRTQMFESLPDRASLFQQNSFDRRLFATQFGYGKRDSNFVFGHVLYGVDKIATVRFDSLQMGLKANQPEQNLVIGCSFAQRVLEGRSRLRLYGEFNKSLSSANRIESPLEAAHMGELANELRFQQGNRASDFSGLIGLSGAIDSLSNFDIQVLRVNPFYKSMGVLFMRSDFQTIRASVNRKLWRKQVIVQIFALDDRTNLYRLKPNGANSIGGGGELSFILPELPQLTVGYQRLFQSDQQPTVADSLSQAGYLEQYQARLQYGFVINEVQLTVHSSGQMVNRSGNNPALNHVLRNWTTQVISTLPYGIQVQMGYQRIHQQHALLEQRIQGAELGLSYALFQSWQQGISYRMDIADTKERRTIIAYNSQILVSKWLQFQVQLAVNQLQIQEREHTWKYIQAGMKINW